jgi:hypothetical protein
MATAARKLFVNAELGSSFDEDRKTQTAKHERTDGGTPMQVTLGEVGR